MFSNLRKVLRIYNVTLLTLLCNYFLAKNSCFKLIESYNDIYFFWLVFKGAIYTGIFNLASIFTFILDKIARMF